MPDHAVVSERDTDATIYTNWRMMIPSLPPGHCPRPRLYGRLTLGMTSRRLTTVIAPPGYGKTTLIAGWLSDLRANAVPLGMAWLSLDEDTCAPRPFLLALTDAIRSAYPSALPGFKAALDAVPAFPPAQLISQLTRGLSALPGRLLLVLDDVDRIDLPDSREIIRSLAAAASLSLHLVLISRDSLRRLTADAAHQSNLSEFHEADLLFDGEEAAALLGRPLRDGAKWAQQATGGRALGLVLARAMQPAGEEWDTFFHIRTNKQWRVVLEAMLQQIATALPDDMRRVWLAAALTKRTSVALSVEMTGLEAPVVAAALASLAGCGLLRQSPGPAPAVYAIHALIGRVLVQGETAEFGPEAVREMRRLAADWLMAHNQPGPALRQWQALGDNDTLAAAVESALPELERNERWPDAHDLLLQLPQSLIDTNPSLLLARIWCLFHLIRGADIGPLLDQADALLGSPQATPDDQAALLRAELELLRGLPSTIAERVARREQINDIITGLARQRTRARAEALFGLYLSNRYTDENLELAEQIEQELGDDRGRELSPALRSSLFSVLTAIYVRHGPVDKLESAGRAMLAAATEARNPNSIAWARSALGMASFLRDEPTQAVLQLEAALYQPPQLGAGIVHIITWHLLSVYAQLRMAGRIPQALDQARRIRTGSPSLDNDWPAMEALGQLLAGDLAGAISWADATPHPPPGVPLDRRPLVLARIRLAEGNPEKLAAALDYLDGYLDIIRAGHFTRNSTQAHAMRARLLWALGRRDEALQTLDEAIDLGYEVGFHHFLIEGEPQMGEMLAALAAHSPNQEQAADLLRRYRQASTQPAPPAAAPPAAPPTGELLLSRREAEILHALAEGKSNKEIGLALGISSITARNHTARLYAKLGVGSRWAAVRRGRELGLLG